MAPDSGTHDQGQNSAHNFGEIEKGIENYVVIVTHVNKIDPAWTSERAKRILDAVFHIYIPKIQESISQASPQRDIHPKDDGLVIGKLKASDLISDDQGDKVLKDEDLIDDKDQDITLISDDQVRKIEQKLETLNALKGGKELPAANAQPIGQESHESPLVLLLSLAIEMKEFSALDPREDHNSPRIQNTKSQNAKGHDWGRLSGFFDYLQKLDFKSWNTSVGKPVSLYWPGVPYCIMALVPLEDANQKELKILVSATADRFRFELTQHLQIFILEKRKERLRNLEELCNLEGKFLIGSVRSYSDKVCEWKKSQPQRLEEMKKCKQKIGESHKKEQDYGGLVEQKMKLIRIKEIQKKQETVDPLKKITDAMKKIEDEVIQKQAHINARIKDAEAETLPDAEDTCVPAYLPVIVSTWTPNGKYLPTCLLDSHRFRYIRPIGAEKSEQSYGSKERGHIYDTISCAEWDGFIKWMSKTMAL